MEHLPTSVVGIGVDIVDITRFAAVLERTPSFVDRIFTSDESQGGDGRSRNRGNYSPKENKRGRFASPGEVRNCTNKKTNSREQH